MTIAIAGSSSLNWGFIAGGTGFSEAFSRLQSDFKAAKAHAEESIVLGWRRRLENELYDAAREASEPGWDGYEAQTVKDSALMIAEHLIQVFPETSPLPDIVPTSRGEIAFEWDGENCFFSVMTHQWSLVYAGTLGPDRKLHGQEPISDELPQLIKTTLEEYFSK